MVNSGPRYEHGAVLEVLDPILLRKLYLMESSSVHNSSKALKLGEIEPFRRARILGLIYKTLEYKVFGHGHIKFIDSFGQHGLLIPFTHFIGTHRFLWHFHPTVEKMADPVSTPENYQGERPFLSLHHSKQVPRL